MFVFPVKVRPLKILLKLDDDDGERQEQEQHDEDKKRTLIGGGGEGGVGAFKEAAIKGIYLIDERERGREKVKSHSPLKPHLNTRNSNSFTYEQYG